MNKFLYIIVLLFFVVSCNSFKENVGLVKYQPDEYQVETNESLSVPPNFNIYSPSEIIANKSKKEKHLDTKLSKGESSILNDMNNNTSDAKLSKGENLILENMNQE